MTEHDPWGPELTGVFDHLEPEHFARVTSAVAERVGRHLGGRMFDRFVEDQIATLCTAYAASEGQADPLAVLSSPTVQRFFLPERDETMGAYVARLHREAEQMGATWVFVATVTEVAVQAVAGPVGHAADDVQVVEAARRQGTLRPGVVWYAERREGLRRTTRVGVLHDEGGRLGEPHESGTQGLGLFDGILG